MLTETLPINETEVAVKLAPDGNGSACRTGDKEGQGLPGMQNQFYKDLETATATACQVGSANAFSLSARLFMN